MAEREDKRIRRTKKLLRQALTRLMKEKDFGSITVTDVVREADINRGTFYRYYRDVPELKEHLETEAAKCFVSAIVSEYKFDAYSDSCRENLFQALKDYPDDAYLLFPNTETYPTSRTKDVFYEILREKSMPEWIKKSSISESEAEVVFYHTVQSMLNLLELWYRGGVNMPEETFKQLYSNLIRNGTHSMVYTKVKHEEINE